MYYTFNINKKVNFVLKYTALNEAIHTKLCANISEYNLKLNNKTVKVNFYFARKVLKGCFYYHKKEKKFPRNF